MAEEFAGRRIVAVEDEPHVLDLIRTTLESAGFVVSGAATGLEGINRIRDELPDIALLDVNLPDMSGFDVLENVRQTLGIPCIMLTVQDDEDARVRGLELGADDYIGKPFGHRELVSRIKAVLRRAEAPAPLARNRVRIDDRLMVDFDRRLAMVDGEAVHLRPTEYKLLHHFMNNPGRLLSHENLLSKVWGPEYRDDTQLLRLYVNYLRKKLEKDPANPKYIFNERGLGYRFTEYTPLPA
ncbi:MAG: response regulator transcription factor [bacterium]|nr:response regulator transcription factor [bacterium]